MTTECSVKHLDWDIGKRCRPRSDAAEHGHNVCFNFRKLRIKWNTLTSVKRLTRKCAEIGKCGNWVLHKNSADLGKLIFALTLEKSFIQSASLFMNIFSNCAHTYMWYVPASVAQLDAPSDWRPGGRGFNPRRGWQHSFVEIDLEIFSTVILSLPLIQEGQLSVSGERMRTILVNRLED